MIRIPTVVNIVTVIRVFYIKMQKSQVQLHIHVAIDSGIYVIMYYTCTYIYTYIL